MSQNYYLVKIVCFVKISLVKCTPCTYYVVTCNLFQEHMKVVSWSKNMQLHKSFIANTKNSNTAHAALHVTRCSIFSMVELYTLTQAAHPCKFLLKVPILVRSYSSCPSLYALQKVVIFILRRNEGHKSPYRDRVDS